MAKRAKTRPHLPIVAREVEATGDGATHATPKPQPRPTTPRAREAGITPAGRSPGDSLPRPVPAILATVAIAARSLPVTVGAAEAGPNEEGPPHAPTRGTRGP